MVDVAGPAPTAHQADVLVVGAGIAGAAALLEAHAAGASVMGIDQLASFGGTTITSGGGCCVAGTALQEANGIRDSVDLALGDLLEAGGGEADEAWARFYLDHAVEDVYNWLVDLGVEFVQVRHNEHDSVPRWHWPRGSGRGLMERVWEGVSQARLGDSWSFSMTVMDLLRDGDSVVGVLARDVAGQTHELRARAVVMATGGFAGSREKVLRHRPDLAGMERLLIGGGAGALGTGHDILDRHGATATHIGNVWCYPTATPDFRDDTGERGLVVRGLEGGIWVNQAGLRFHDESRPGPGTAMPALLAQVPPTCWAIVDRATIGDIRIADPYFRGDDGTAPERIEELVARSPFVHREDDPAVLARRAGIAPSDLVRTLRAWNEALLSGEGVDPLTGRRLAGLAPLDAAPYYAIQLFPLARKNLGGVQTDLRCRVLSAGSGARGETIPGLFAAGELCGFAGGHLSGRNALEGIMIGASLFSGRVAGGWAAHSAGRPVPSHLDADLPPPP